MKAQPVGKLEVAGPMCQANRSHVSDIGVSGATGHRGSDGNKAAQRLRNNGGVVQGGGAVKEGIEFGPWINGADFVIALLVGDGESTRTHRKILLDANSGALGVALGSHSKYGKVCVVTVAPSCVVLEM